MTIRGIFRVLERLTAEGVFSSHGTFIKDAFLNYRRYGILGNSIRIDACSSCQLRCPACPQTIGVPIKKNYLRFEGFKSIVDVNRTIRNVELSDKGEIFLNPDLSRIMHYCFSNGINLTARNGVNLNDVQEKVLEHLVRYRFRILTVSIDGATEETYPKYRIGGNFERVMSHIAKINEFKRRYQSPWPRLVWQFIVFGHNMHEIEKAKMMARQLGMAFVLKFNNEPSYSPVTDFNKVRDYAGFASKDDYEKKTRHIWMFQCHHLWFAPQISWDGALIGCSTNWGFGDYGNVFENGLRGCLRGEKYVYAKRMLLGKVPERTDIPCLLCPKYPKVKQMKKLGLFRGLWNQMELFYQ